MKHIRDILKGMDLLYRGGKNETTEKDREAQKPKNVQPGRSENASFERSTATHAGRNPAYLTIRRGR